MSPAAPTNFTPATLPADVCPYGWQLAVASRLAAVGRLAVEAAPGAGKTLAAFAAAGACGARSIAIIAPAGRVSRQWVSVADACGCDTIMAGGRGQGGRAMAEAAAAHLAFAQTSDRPRAVVIPWSRLARPQDAEALLSGFRAGAIQPVDLLVVDESHYAQGAEERARGLALLGGRPRGARKDAPIPTGLRHYARRVLALSGTPTPSDPKRIRAQLLLAGVDAKHPELASKFRYEAQHWNGRKEYHHGARRELWTCDDRPGPHHDALIRAGILRVSAEDLRAQLPAHRRILVSGFHEGAVPAALAAWAEHGGPPGGLPALEELADLRREATARRRPEIADRCAQWHREAPAGRMMIVWCCYQDSADALAVAIGAALAADDDFPVVGAAPAARLHGGLPDRERAATVEAASAGKVRVLVATHASTGTGTDGLQRSGAFAFAVEAPWTPGECEQSEGRLFRAGQREPVVTEWLACGIEGAILAGAGVKAAAIGETMAAAEVLTLEAASVAEAVCRAGAAAAPMLSPIEAQRARQEAQDAAQAALPDPEACAWSWAKHRATGAWALRANCGGRPDWAGATVTVRNRAGQETSACLIARLVGGDGWSLWSFEKIQNQQTLAERDRSYLVRRAKDRGIVQDDQSPLTTEADKAAAEAAHHAAMQLTTMDGDRAMQRNAIGWSQADTTVGRILNQIPACYWTQATLAFARAILRKYARTQIGPARSAAIWPKADA